MTVHCGHVYHLYLPIAQKNKLVVPAYIIPEDERVRFFVINTNLNNFVANNKELASHAIQLSAANNNRFLNRDSWLVCHEVVGGLTAPDIEATNNCYRGPLDNDSLSKVRDLLPESRLYSEVEKSKILSQWPE